jgi:hypothetical protein
MDKIDIEIIKTTAYWEGVWKAFQYLNDELGEYFFDTDLAEEARLELGLGEVSNED